MSLTRFVAVLTIAVLGVSTVSVVHAAEKEETRPAILPVLYATLGVVQAWDVYSTSVAMNAGAREANPAAAAFAGNSGSLIGLKAATTASTIFFAERLWKKNKAAAIVMLAAINGATAAVSMHNMHNARAAVRR